MARLSQLPAVAVVPRVEIDNDDGRLSAVWPPTLLLAVAAAGLLAMQDSPVVGDLPEEPCPPAPAPTCVTVDDVPM